MLHKMESANDKVKKEEHDFHVVPSSVPAHPKDFPSPKLMREMLPSLKKKFCTPQNEKLFKRLEDVFGTAESYQVQIANRTFQSSRLVRPLYLK